MKYSSTEWENEGPRGSGRKGLSEVGSQLQRPASAWSCVSLQPHPTARVQLQVQKGDGVGFTQHGVASTLLECSPLPPFSSLTWATVRASHESSSGETPSST